MAKVECRSETGRLVGDYYAASGRLAVVWAHGFGSDRGGEKSEAVREECERRGWPFARFDFHGHGESDGTLLDLRVSRLIDDLEKIFRFLEAQGHSRFGLIGSSMGGMATAWFAKQKPNVVGTVLIAPAFHFLDRRWNQLTEAERQAWQQTGKLRVVNDWLDVEIGYGLAEERQRFPLKNLVADWQTPALLLHGSADEVVPDTDSLQFLRSVNEPRVEVRLYKAGDHRLTAYKSEIAKAAGEFLARHCEE